jgi:CrcB protein
MNITTILVVGVGGFLGTIARYISVQTIDKALNALFPYGTFTVNLIGSFILGFVMGGVTSGDQSSGNWKLFLTVGFCGGFTTFSAFAFENLNLLQQRLVTTSLLYAGVSIIAGLAAVAAGFYVGKLIS